MDGGQRTADIGREEGWGAESKESRKAIDNQSDQKEKGKWKWKGIQKGKCEGEIARESESAMAEQKESGEWEIYPGSQTGEKQP